MVRRTLLVGTLFCLAAFGADISGKWDFHVETDAGAGDPTFEFHQDGEKLTGTYAGTFGTAPLTGTVKGDDIEFSFEVTVLDQKGTIVYKGKIGADGKMKGEVELTGLGKGTWTGQRHS
ncbi:MAG TPA: hypothetical protein VKX45_22260 [Bryobacteraceae bacterium]|jgi:hypothetical protein|nr:hypothetical protein [Bryobacteraceae bacterium]